MSRIKDLGDGDKNLVIEGYIIEKAETRTVISAKTGFTYEVCNFLLAETRKPDAENSITLVLWNENIEKFRIGDKVLMQNVYVTKFRDHLQLNVGKYGAIHLAVVAKPTTLAETSVK